MSTQPLDHYFDALRTEARLPERTLDDLTDRAARGEIAAASIPSVAAASIFSVPVIAALIAAAAAIAGVLLLTIPDDSLTTTRSADAVTHDALVPGGEVVENVDTSMRRRTVAKGSGVDSSVRTGGKSHVGPPSYHGPSRTRPRSNPNVVSPDRVSALTVPAHPPLADADFAAIAVAEDPDDTLPSVRNINESSDLPWQRIGDYEVAPLITLNSIGDDFNLLGVGPSYFFLSDRSVGNAQKRMWGTTSSDGPRGPFTTPGPLGETINAPGTSIDGFTCTPGGFVLIIAIDVSGGSDDDVDLYEAERAGGEWKNLRRLPTLSTRYVETDPSLSADGDTLFFISDRPGGPGMGDDNIWMSVRSPGGDWGAPVILPEPINTPMREAAPLYSSVDGSLTFSSEGGWGHGGLDVFSSARTADGGWRVPRNLGPPISSYGNDRACMLLDGGDLLLFASTRSDLESRGGYDLFVAVRSR